MSDLMPFVYGDTQMRVVMVDGEPEFVAADVCRMLGHSNPTAAVAGLDDDERGLRNVETPSGAQQMVTVTEAGLYALIIRSRKPEAKAIKRWITHEVLPSIRKTGSYGQPAAPSLPSARELAQMVIDAEDAREAAEKQLLLETKARRAVESYAKDLEPRAEFYDKFMDADGTYSVGAVAKMLGTSQNKLYDELRNAEVLIAKGCMRNTPYQRYMHHFAVKAYEYERHDGTRGTSYTTRVQPSGIEFVARKVGRAVTIPAATS